MPAGSLVQITQGTRQRPYHVRRNKRRTKAQPLVRRRNIQAVNKWFAPVMQFQRGVNPFPQEWLVRPHFSHYTVLNTPATQLAGAVTYRLNSIYYPDPGRPITGNQPFQYDQLTPLYNKSIVYAAKVDIVWNNPSVDGMYCGYGINSGTSGTNTSGLTIDRLKELPNVKLVRVNNTGSQIKRQSFYIRMNEALGMSKDHYMGLSDVNEVMGSGPAPTVYWVNVTPFVIYPSTPSAQSVEFEIRITYYTKLYGFKDPATS